MQKEAERLAEKDVDYYDAFVQRKDDKLFPIFFARSFKPLDYSSGGEEDDEDGSEGGSENEKEPESDEIQS